MNQNRTDLAELLAEECRRQAAIAAVPRAPLNDRRMIRAFYRLVTPWILEEPCNIWGIDSYAWRPFIELTPIEESLWHDIRYYGVVVYPQYPVGPYFVDFGNPAARVAIECDGHAFHSTPEQIAADRLREGALADRGWRVVRINGRDCRSVDTESVDADTGAHKIELSAASRFMIDVCRSFGIGRMSAVQELECEAS